MDAATLKAIQEAVATGTAGMVSWTGIVATITPVVTAIGIAFRLLWVKYTEAREALEKYTKEQAAAADGKAAAEKENALKWVQIRDDLATHISNEWKARVEEWKKRYFDEQTTTKEQVGQMLGQLKGLLEKLEAEVPAAMNDNTAALVENNEAIEAVGGMIEALENRLEAVDKGLKATEHNYRSLKPILTKVSEIAHRAQGEG